MNGPKPKNPIIAYWRESKGGRYLSVSVDAGVLRNIFSQDGQINLAVFFNQEKRTENTPDIVVKASETRKQADAGQPQQTNTAPAFPFGATAGTKS